MAYDCATRYAKLNGLNVGFTLTYDTVKQCNPLFVHCDASATIASGVADPFRNLWYKWVVTGAVVDTSAWGNWSYGRQVAKNTCYGPIAGFLLTAADTYTITLTVFDGYAQKTISQTVVVADQDATFATTNTIAINANGDADFSGAPSGATTYNCPAGDNFRTAISANMANGKRLLFKAGTTFTQAVGDVAITSKTGCVIGSYGAANNGRAIWATGLNGDFCALTSVTSFRFQDIEIDGTGFATAIAANLKNAAAGAQSSYVTYSNVYAHAVGKGMFIGVQGTTLDIAAPLTCVGIFGCRVEGMAEPGGSGYALFAFAKQFCVIGNNFDANGNGTGAHVTRFGYAQKFNISNNDVKNPSAGQGTLKVVSLDRDVFGVVEAAATRQGVVSDNMVSGSGSAYGLAMTPVTSSQNGLVEYVIAERNFFTAGSSSSEAFWNSGQNNTYRNNIDIMTGAASALTVFVKTDGSSPAPQPTGNEVLNISMYNAISDSSAHTFLENDNGSDTIFGNCVLWAPAADGTLTVVSGSAVTHTNSSASQITGASSPFSSAAPSTAADFAAANYALTAGTLLNVFDDYNADLRYFGNKTPVIDMGAVQTS